MNNETYVYNQQKHVYDLLKTIDNTYRVTEKIAQSDLKNDVIIEYSILQTNDMRFSNNRGRTELSYILDVYCASASEANEVSYKIVDKLRGELNSFVPEGQVYRVTHTMANLPRMIDLLPDYMSKNWVRYNFDVTHILYF
jgi:hypothetical protein